MTRFVTILLGIIIVAFLVYLTRQKGAQPLPAAQQVQEQCLARVAEVLLIYKHPGRPVAELALARKLCYDGERPATRVVHQLNKIPPKLKDGRVK